MFTRIIIISFYPESDIFTCLYVVYFKIVIYFIKFFLSLVSFMETLFVLLKINMWFIIIIKKILRSFRSVYPTVLLKRPTH